MAVLLLCPHRVEGVRNSGVTVNTLSIALTEMEEVGGHGKMCTMERRKKAQEEKEENVVFRY